MTELFLLTQQICAFQHSNFDQPHALFPLSTHYYSGFLWHWKLEQRYLLKFLRGSSTIHLVQDAITHSLLWKFWHRLLDGRPIDNSKGHASKSTETCLSFLTCLDKFNDTLPTPTDLDKSISEFAAPVHNRQVPCCHHLHLYGSRHASSSANSTTANKLCSCAKFKRSTHKKNNTTLYPTTIVLQVSMQMSHLYEQ